MYKKGLIPTQGPLTIYRPGTHSPLKPMTRKAILYTECAQKVLKMYSNLVTPEFVVGWGGGGQGHTQLWISFLYHDDDDDSFLFSHMRIFVKCVLSAQACE